MTEYKYGSEDLYMTIFEYQYLKGEFRQPGAALNQTYEFCQSRGWCDIYGDVTPEGRRALEEYER